MLCFRDIISMHRLLCTCFVWIILNKFRKNLFYLFKHEYDLSLSYLSCFFVSLYHVLFPSHIELYYTTPLNIYVYIERNWSFIKKISFSFSSKQDWPNSEQYRLSSESGRKGNYYLQAFTSLSFITINQATHIT